MSVPFSLEIKDISKIYGKEFKALNGVSLTVRQGDIVALIGPSGSGKSTLLRTINRLESIEGGDIHINGVSIFGRNVDRNQLCEQVGMIFQSFNLFPHLSILDNITLAPRIVKKMSRQVADELAMELLVKVGIEDQARKYPLQLSGGQQQRVAIARSLILKPELILFDEPTSALDPELVGDVLAIINKLAIEQTTMMIVTHEMEFAKKIAHKVIFMNEGKIVEQGTPQWVFEDCQTPRLRKFLAKF